MAHYRIKGGMPLKGTITTHAGKNSPVALICAALLTRGKTQFKGITPVTEVLHLIELLESIGVKITWTDDTTIVVDTTDELNMKNMNVELCRKMRISLLFMGALAAREKTFQIFKTGGCNLGSRTIRPHLFALQKLGIHISSDEDAYTVTVSELKGADIVMYESGDTATENAIIAAVLAPGKTKIQFASANYMVQDLCYYLKSIGAKIDGIGTTTLHIEGVEELQTGGSYYAMPDPVDAMAWISLAITTKSELTIENCPLDFLALELEKLRVMGQQCTISNTRKSKNGHFDVADITLHPSELTALPDKLTCQPYPGLNIDALPLFIPILTQAEGQTLVFDWVYENRAIYALELQKLGADVILMDPHRLLIQGKTSLVGTEVECPPAIRPGMSILISMIAAQGESLLKNVYPIERAYLGLIDRLKDIGVDIVKIEE